MSNKTILQNCNNRLNTNNTDLDTILSKINNLPESGGTAEDLSTELTEQDTLIDNQEATIEDVMLVLQNKAAGSGEVNLQEKAITPTTSKQNVIADTGYTGLSKVIVNAVTSSIDSDIKASNIKSGVDILGVTGTLKEYVAPTLQSKTATPKTTSQTITADSGYDGLSQVTVSAMPTATQATPSISVNSSGLITASSTQTAGYVAAGTKSSTKQLTTKAATTYTPTTSNQTIASGTYLTGTQTIKGDSNLVAGNIKKGVSVFGVTGTLEEGTTEDLSVELTEQDGLIDAQETATNTQETTIANLISKLQNKASGGGGNSLKVLAGAVDKNGDASMMINSDCGFIEDGGNYQVAINLEDETSIENNIIIEYDAQMTEFYISNMLQEEVKVYTGAGDDISLMVIHNYQVDTNLYASLLLPSLISTPTSDPLAISYIKQ
jgi:hypothetical protein